MEERPKRTFVEDMKNVLKHLPQALAYFIVNLPRFLFHALFSIGDVVAAARGTAEAARDTVEEWHHIYIEGGERRAPDPIGINSRVEDVISYVNSSGVNARLVLSYSNGIAKVNVYTSRHRILEEVNATLTRYGWRCSLADDDKIYLTNGEVSVGVVLCIRRGPGGPGGREAA